MKTHSRAIWAIDPTAKDPQTQLSVLKNLLAVTSGRTTSVIPVTVLAPEQIRVPSRILVQEQKKFRAITEKLIKSWYSAMKEPRIQAPVVLIQKKHSLNASVETLLNYATRTKAEMVALGTHGRTGMDRFILGSFAETLILKSRIPALIINPASRKVWPSKIDTILFPTDFSTASKEAFIKTLQLAFQIKASVALYNKLELVVPAPNFSLPYVDDPAVFFKEEKRSATRIAKQWVTLGKQKGVKVAYSIDETPFYTAEGIALAAKRLGADLIAMASQSTRVRAALVGSVARSVVRLAASPVWVLNSR